MQKTPDCCWRWSQALVSSAACWTLRWGAAQMPGLQLQGAVRRSRALRMGCLNLLHGRWDALLLWQPLATELRCN